jgi:hypothetical protein
MSRNQRQRGKRQFTSTKVLLDPGKRLLRNAGICSIQASGSFFRARVCPDQESLSPNPLALARFRQIAAWMGRILARSKRAKGTIGLFAPISPCRFPDPT